MELKEILMGGGGGLFALLTILQISPIKINPWSALARSIGRALNKDVLERLATLEGEQKEIKSELVAQKALSDRREANGWRADILRFNMELVEHTRHTREDYIEILDVIDKYETYCETHKEYENNRAVHAIANIERRYDDRLKNNDFA
nr:MAG TPA: hypothetical protein [Caudoviricetes sp.]